MSALPRLCAALALWAAACGETPARVPVPDDDRSPPSARIGVADGRGRELAAATVYADAAREVRRGRLRYWPPPQIERIRAAPGALLPTRARRHKRLVMRCGRDAQIVRGEAEVWGEVIDGLGLEAVTRHVRVRYDGRP